MKWIGLILLLLAVTTTTAWSASSLPPKCETVPAKTYNAQVHVLKAISGKRPNFADRSVCASKFYELRDKIKTARKRCLEKAHQSWASYYDPEGTAGKYRYDHPGVIGTAHKTLPLGSKRFFHLGRRTQRARIIDRGPYVSGREWDFTVGLKNRLGAGDLAYVWSSLRNCWAVAR